MGRRTSHALGAHLLAHDLGAVERLQRGVREAVHDAEEEDERDRRVRPFYVRVPRLPVLARERGDDREQDGERERAQVEPRAAVEAVRDERAGEGAEAGEDVVRKVVEELGVLVRDAGVGQDGRQEVSDELGFGHDQIRLLVMRDCKGLTPLPASWPLMHMRMRASMRQRALAVL